MGDSTCIDFDYSGFLQESKEAMSKYKMTSEDIANCTDIDASSVREVFRRNDKYSFRTAIAFSKALNISIDKYVRAL